MEIPLLRSTALMIILLTMSMITPVSAAQEDLGNGFMHHGVATQVSNHRGTVATVDGQGRNIVLAWLFDHRGGYALLLIDAQTGKSEQFPFPFNPRGDAPYASVLSSANKFYTHFGKYFVEFDPAKRAFTFHHKTAPQMAMGMTEDDKGIIWSVTYPNSGVVSFDPQTREFKDYGYVHKENWPQYQRYVAADDAGWIYFGIGNTSSHVIGFDPSTGKAKPMIPESERITGSGLVYRDINGKVYGHPGGTGDKWYELHKGQAKKIGQLLKINHKPIITGQQDLFHTDFPDGTKLEKCDLAKRVLTVKSPKSQRAKKIKFDYTSEGAHIMGVTVAPNGTICGGTHFPFHFFSYNPRIDKWLSQPNIGQWNTVVRQGNRLFGGSYPYGKLLEWSPLRRWSPYNKDKRKANPLLLAECQPTIYRPHDLLAHPDGNTIILAGTPGYGYTGGGLLFWDRKKKKSTLIEHTDILPQHSTMSLVALPEGKLLGGSTTSAGTGGEKKAKQAEVYIMDMATKKVEWHEPLIRGVQEYTDLCLGPDGLVYGVADRKHFFVFDPAKRKVINQQNTRGQFGPTSYQQGPRSFVLDPKGNIYILFNNSIARLESDTFKITLLAKSPVKSIVGGDYYEGRIYFASGPRLYSYKVPSRLTK